MYLRARSADPVPDHVGVWRLASDAEDLHEFNLDQNVRSYIASSAHLSHERLLSTDVEELENGSDAKVFAEAYLAYAERVERGAEHWQAKQRVSDAQLHRRLSAALRRYAAGLVVEDGPEL
jgi:hypothetical protein